jgi:2-hydroxychromene-2-carboxylate isomerase
MPETVPVSVFFNFRSPYCYLASKSMFRLFDDFDVDLAWYPLAGYDGRSQPERQKYKLPIVRQDVSRFAARLGIPFRPPPMHTDSTRAGAGSLFAEEKGVLRPYVVETMRAEWGRGEDIGDVAVLTQVAQRVGLDAQEFQAVIDSPAYLERLSGNWKAAEAKGVFGVPTFVVEDQVFWGNDRLDFVAEKLRELRLSRL